MALGFERCILLMCDSLTSTQGGIGGANRSLALDLTRYKGIKVVTTSFKPLQSIPIEDRQELQDNSIELICPSEQCDPDEIYKTVNEAPLEVFPTLPDIAPNVTHIVGHSPITASAAIELRETLYHTAKIILFYHVIPEDVAWMEDKLAYTMPNDTELVRLAEQVDVVYSVSEKVHWFYTAKFRNRAQTKIDHRLFLPQCGPEVFGVEKEEASVNKPAQILFFSTTDPATGIWEGLDIASCAVSKVDKICSTSEGMPSPQLTIGAVPKSEVDRTKEVVKNASSNHCIADSLKINTYNSTADLLADLAACTLCIVPSRAEPYGYRGLFALSAGVPTLISEDSSLAPIIRRLTSEPEYFLVPVTKSVDAYRQDASVWRDRILEVLKDPETAYLRAQQLKMALRRDEPTKETHDNVICFTLGGIRLTHEATSIELIYKHDEEKELEFLRKFNKVLGAIMKQCWRLKHHALTTPDDLYQVVPGVELPIQKLIDRVTDQIESWDRRIVGMDEDTNAFLIYCPTPSALSDLWAMCDKINDMLVHTILVADDNPLLSRLSIKKVNVRSVINGPEFLKYKMELLSSPHRLNHK